MSSFKIGVGQHQELTDRQKLGNAHFDARLLYSLTRNLSLSSVNVPSNGQEWLLSLSSSVNIGDDIGKIRDFHNRGYGHADSKALPYRLSKLIDVNLNRRTVRNGKEAKANPAKKTAFLRHLCC